MKFDLSALDFSEEDIYTQQINFTRSLVFYNIQEDFTFADGDAIKEHIANEILIEYNNNEEKERYSNIIGLDKVKSDYTELQGQKLNSSNFAKCYLEIEEDE